MSELTIYPLAIGGVYKSKEDKYVIAVNYCEFELTKEPIVIYKLLDYSNDIQSYVELDKLYVSTLVDWFARYNIVATNINLFNKGINK